MIKPLEELDIQYIFNPILRVEGARGWGSQNIFLGVGGLSLDTSRINIVKTQSKINLTSLGLRFDIIIKPNPTHPNYPS